MSLVLAFIAGRVHCAILLALLSLEADGFPMFLARLNPKSDKVRNALTASLTVLMAVTSFAAGFLLNEVKDRSVQDRVVSGAMPVYWEAWARVEESFMGDVPSDTQRTYAAIRGSLSLLGDPYTVFIEPQAREQEKVELRGNFGGIGVILSRNEVGGPIQMVVPPDSPAAIAGVLDGDVLVAVDGHAISSEMAIEDVRLLIVGEKGTEVVVTLLHRDSTTPERITIVRGDILLPSVWHRILDEDGTIGYIQLSRFSGESKGEMERALSAVRNIGASSLILDLRQNGGGLLDAAVDIADLFLNDGVILVQRSGKEETIFEAAEGAPGMGLDMVILVDAGTASAAEILAGALDDRGMAFLIGSPTYGKGSVQLVYDLSDGSSVHVTSARWFTPSGQQLDGVGLMPDIVVEPSAEALADGRDESLARAVAYIQNGE